MQAMPHEVWATYSVRDHLVPGAFIEDVLFYDHLVLPVPSEEQSPEGEWEWDRWERIGWKPQKQRDLLETLADVAISIPWTQKRQLEWYQRRDALHDNAFKATADLLCENVPIYAFGRAAMVGPAYPSLQELKQDFNPVSDEASEPVPGAALPVVLGQEFLVTHYPDQSYDYQLKKALELARNPEFQQKRARLTQWQQQFLQGGVTDLASMAKAVKDMHELIEEEKHAIPPDLKTTVRYGYRIAMGTVAVVGAVLGGPVGMVLAAGGAFMSIAELAIDAKLLDTGPLAGLPQPSPAAFFIAANKAFIHH